MDDIDWKLTLIVLTVIRKLNFWNLGHLQLAGKCEAVNLDQGQKIILSFDFNLDWSRGYSPAPVHLAAHGHLDNGDIRRERHRQRLHSLAGDDGLRLGRLGIGDVDQRGLLPFVRTTHAHIHACPRRRPLIRTRFRSWRWRHLFEVKPTFFSRFFISTTIIGLN